MKTIKFLFICLLICTFFSSCSDDDFASDLDSAQGYENKSLTRGELFRFSKHVQSTTSYYDVPFGFEKRNYFSRTVRDIKSVPATVVYTMSQTYPNHTITSYEKKVISAKNKRQIYILRLNENLDFVVFENGYPLVSSTTEIKMSQNEKQAKDMTWHQYLAVANEHTKEYIEEITSSTNRGAILVDFKSGTTYEYSRIGSSKFIGKDELDDDHRSDIDPNNLAQIILDYVSANYPNETITSAEVDASGYEVFLSNGLKLEFDINGNFIEISGESEGLGQDINVASLPQVVLDYIAINYPDQSIVEAEQYPNQFEVTLNNGLKLEFDLNGNFLEISGGMNDNDQDDDGDNINPNSLPQAILDYIATNYPNVTIIEAEEYPTQFEVTLSNGLKLEFDSTGNFIEISGNNDNDGENDGNDIPASSLPQAILDYITINYPGSTIVEAEEYPNQYEVTLNNGLKLEFDLNGNFIEVSGGINDHDNDGVNINPNSLPQAIHDYVSNNYPRTTIIKAEEYPNEFEITLSNGLKLEFDLNGNFLEISGNNGDNDGEGQHINPATLPQAILDYIATTYPGTTIVDAEQYPNQFEIELNNGLELEFDLDGNFIELSGGCNDIPQSQLPQTIQDWVSSNYPGVGYDDIERCPTEYEIKLDNDVEIIFDLEGNVIEIDD